jgi:hypothetical protein
MRRISFSIISFLIFICIVVNNSQAEINKEDDLMKYKRIDIYFVGWDIMTRIPLTIEDVRRMKRIFISINDPSYVTNFISWLKIDTFKARKEEYVEDPRLVIDLITANGDRHVFYANKIHLFSLKSNKYREVNEEFLKKFELVE